MYRNNNANKSGNGWIANQMKDILVAQRKTIIMSRARIESREQVLRY